MVAAGGSSFSTRLQKGGGGSIDSSALVKAEEKESLPCESKGGGGIEANEEMLEFRVERLHCRVGSVDVILRSESVLVRMKLPRRRAGGV